MDDKRMTVVAGVDALRPEHGPLVAVVGVFDGLHRGHTYLLEHLVAEAKARDGRPTVITFDHHPDEVALYLFPMFHIAAYALIVYLLRGYSVVLMRGFEARAYLQAVQRHRVTMHAIAPTMLAMVLDHSDLERHDTSSLRLMLYGASAMPLSSTVHPVNGTSPATVAIGGGVSIVPSGTVAGTGAPMRMTMAC